MNYRARVCGEAGENLYGVFTPSPRCRLNQAIKRCAPTIKVRQIRRF
ncbi:hypothetical protein P262_02799 [Cronobacter malonaticus]|uniref:Uncharacterized protein n=1 Tax=Cronobacter malonaticus TaxID=413503 RepID=V5TYY7_9ENTR|nr:hypothetical protein P262_02799 [Cronobacter malonaticus]CCJ98251.1 hypothetical protein BN130_810 [Cronobacter malonaticus 507]